MVAAPNEICMMHAYKANRGHMTVQPIAFDTVLGMLGNRFGALALTVTDLIDDSFRDELPVQGSDAHALILLAQKQALKIDTLARQLKLAHSSTVRLVDRLERSGYVIRQPGRDKRAVLLSLSDSGHGIVSKILKARQVAVERVLSSLKPEEACVLLDLVNRLLEGVSTDLGRCEHICRQCDENACDLDVCPVERRYLTMPGAMTGPEM
ncbi:hypothetical protein CXB38_27845 [Pseudomonas syringae]|nr:hypothetical protein CXB38_27845 [Pseudomonas syringae]